MGEAGMDQAAKYDGRLKRMARSIARKIKGADPDDVASTYFRRIGASPDRTAYKDTEQFMSISAAIMKNAAFNQARKNMRELKRIEDYQLLTTQLNLNMPEFDPQHAKAVINSVLDRESGSAWIMRMHLDGKSNRYIAQREGVTDKTIASRLDSLKTQIARELECIA